MMKVTETGNEDGFFTEAYSAELVLSRNHNAENARLKQVMASLVPHLHAFIKEVEPTQAEWAQAIEMLTRTGQMCTEWRQEYILLSDVLGVSMLVDAINNRKPSGATATTVQGPFHVSDAPRRANGDNICLDGKGEPLLVHGRVTGPQGAPIPSALLDVWQANDEGFYDVQQPAVQPAMNLRGVFETDHNGDFWFRSVRPRFYPIPGDGPVGQLLGHLGRSVYRPAHIHFMVAAEGYQPITTHIFTPDCPYLHSDAVFGVKQSLIGDFHQVDDGEEARRLGFETPFWSARCDFVLAKAAR